GVYDDQGKLVAGLSISAPADRLDEGWLPKLQATASEISVALGYVAATENPVDPTGSTARNLVR
ncbi:MAG: IclR family transcriptional regulator, partial [Burkholderiaceae bacterium]|nr:IclR family transcriptional regulator [Burkholderiaceae bacterium]